jgi:hypothetical protein
MNQVQIAGPSILDARLDLVKARSGRPYLLMLDFIFVAVFDPTQQSSKLYWTNRLTATSYGGG